MAENGHPELLLGKQTPLVAQYSPGLLYPLRRAEGRQALGLDSELPFSGCDHWHAYELSWLGENGRPEVRVGRFSIPAESACMVESKSFKLYLNSLNNSVFTSEDAFAATVITDLAGVVGAEVELQLFEPDSSALAGLQVQGACLDTLTPRVVPDTPEQGLLQVVEDTVSDEVLYSHLLRSLCPVTGQPDWATVWLRYSGKALERTSLLTYLLAYRNHPEFHEQCVERMFYDIQQVAQPERLEVQAFYTRRGGLDISPYRTSEATGQPLPRLNRQ
ncbi:MAG: NADPH-dependent 7-cyano-7-deazaguanine reductase QueF [Halioglobus sp.]